jgi:hypothetical protein
MGKRKRDRQPQMWVAVTDRHSTISRTRRLIDLETHRAVFTWVLQCLSMAGLVKGKTVGIDATTLEANAALRSIVRRDTGEGYEEFLTRLAKASGISTPTRADLARIDRKRNKKGSNDDWMHPHDPDAKIANLKRLFVHASAFNLGLWMRTLFGIGTPRALQGRLAAFATVFAESWNLTLDAIGRRWRQNVPLTPARRSMNEYLACS